MPKISLPEYKVHIDQLMPGVFIRLDSIWFNHPFLFNRFKIKGWDQIQTLRDCGIEEVICVPSRSDCLPRPIEEVRRKTEQKEEPPQKNKKDPALEQMWEIKKQRIAKLKQKREELARCQERYNKSIAMVPKLLNGILSGSPETVEQANAFVGGMVETFQDETDAVVHLMDSKCTEDGLYYHSLNVAVLALMIGKALQLSGQEMHDLGMGAMFHDIGKSRIEKRILRKPPPLSKPEKALIQMHPKYGVEIALKSKGFSQETLKIIFQHHERMGGQGYPKGAKGEQISRLARIVTIADIYDNLVNNPQQEKAVTPYQCMSFMFAKMKQLIDIDVFTAFIHSVGIYPPGTILQLSNEVIAMVLSVNPRNPLKPSLLLYDPEIPRDEAIIFDMEEDPELSVTKSIHPRQLPREIFNYLNPRTQLNYFMDTPSEAKGG